MAEEGEVLIDLAGKAEVLTSNLGAARRVNAHFGGFSAVYEKLAAFDLETYAALVAYGLGKKTVDDDIAERVFKTGLVPLNAPLLQFLAQLLNGGRDTRKDQGEEPQKGEA